MKVMVVVLAAVVGTAFVANLGAVAQTQTYPPEGYSPLLFDPADTKVVFRLSGSPWICRSDSFCKPVKIDGVADKDLAQAEIQSLGFAGQRYFLSYKQANFEKGKETALSCVEERCEKLDSVAGSVAPLGTFQVKQGDRVQTRAAMLRKLEARNGRAQLLWCTETDCAELPLTRDNEMTLAFIGSGRVEGRTLAWLRDQAGAVWSCSQPEEGASDQLACEKSPIVLGDFPAAAAPSPAPMPPAPPAASVAERNALAASIDRAIVAGDFATADRLMADATRRYAGNAAWPPLQQKLARARAEREAQARQAEARQLIVEALRFADVGDFAHAEQMLQDADKLAPGFAGTAQARAQIATRRTERGQRYRERYQYYAAIDQAFTAEQLWEAERLLGEYAQRFSPDDEHRQRAARLAQMRSASQYQARIHEARAHVARARQAMDRADFVAAERELALADRTAPGFPEIGETRADLSRRRIAAERQQGDLRLILAFIDAALQGNRYDDAERAIEDGRRRFGSYGGWSDLQARSASARRGDDRQAAIQRARNEQALKLVTAARRNTTQGDFTAAEKAITEARVLSPNLPEIAIAHAELERAKADRARQDAEIRALVASIDAALARKQFTDAERLIADGKKRYAAHAGWAELSRRLAEARRATPNQTGNAPMPAQPPGAAPPPAGAPPRAAQPPAAQPPAAQPPAAQPAPPRTPTVAQLVATARAAIRRSDFAAAEKAVADAEKIDAKAADVIDVRADLKAAQERPPRERPPGERQGGTPPAAPGSPPPAAQPRQ